MACSTVIHAAFFFDVSIFMIQYTWMAYAAQMDVTNIKMRNLEKCNISLSWKDTEFNVESALFLTGSTDFSINIHVSWM